MHVTYVIGGHEPSHLRAGGQLSINEALDFAFRPAIVDVHDGNVVPLRINDWKKRREYKISAPQLFIMHSPFAAGIHT